MKLNSPRVAAPMTSTYEGGLTKVASNYKQLRRAVLSCLLWEDNFYESGEDVATRINKLAKTVDPVMVAALSNEAKQVHKLRHAPLWLSLGLLGTKNSKVDVAKTIASNINRADELSEVVAMYWKDGKKPLANQLKKALNLSFQKFSAFDLQKWNKNDATVKLRDVMFLTHPTPVDAAQAAAFKAIADNVSSAEAEKATGVKVDTWEKRLSAGNDKKASFIDLMNKKKMGATAFISNIRGMLEAGVPEYMIRDYAKNVKTEFILPFRFISAAKAVPALEDMFEEMMLKNLEGFPKLNGRTALFVDVSGSMFGPKISAKSELDRFDAAAALAMLTREICETVDVYTFSNNTVRVSARRGFALREALSKSQPHGGTTLDLSKAVGYDRVIVFGDGEHGNSLRNVAPKQYMINVAPYKNSVSHGSWVEVQGFSEAIMRYIVALEAEE